MKYYQEMVLKVSSTLSSLENFSNQKVGIDISKIMASRLFPNTFDFISLYIKF